MNPLARQQQILSRLRAIQREWRVDEIATALEVSPLTVRRDLDRLAEEGTILRTHGGCIYAGRIAQEAPYHERVAARYELKRAIGAKAARQIGAGETILVDDGSTCFHVATQLPPNTAVSLYTNSMPIVAELASARNVAVTLLGGAYDARHQHLGGPVTEWMLDRFTFDRVFLGSDCVDAAGRCLVETPEIARTARAMLARGRRRILLADHTKCAAAAGRVEYARLKDFDEWITTSGIPQGMRRSLGRMTRLTVVIAARNTP